jgi:hypothetical protein
MRAGRALRNFAAVIIAMRMLIQHHHACRPLGNRERDDMRFSDHVSGPIDFVQTASIGALCVQAMIESAVWLGSFSDRP